jgi:DNA-binding transcriptional regulator LsrR (DeoR family)
LDPSDFFSQHTSPVWAALSSIISGIGAWLLSRRNISAMIERARIESSVEVSASETEERTAFRAMLMTEVTIMRQLVRECDADNETLRERLNTAMAQSLVLRATVEIMEKRVAFGRQRQALGGESEPGGNTGQDVK